MSLDDSTEVEFREGRRFVPGYIARQLPERDLLITMTYAQAMDWINRQQLIDYANAAQRKAVNAHFKDHR
jgi:hypothetical protein